MLISLRSVLLAAALVPFGAAAFAQTTPAKPVITSYDATSSTPSFHGTADPSMTIRGRWDYGELTPTTSAADGTWNINWSGDPLEPGTYHVYVNAVDPAGNWSTSSDSVVVTVAPTSVPEVEPIADQDTTWEFFRHDEGDRMHISATNAPTQYNVTGLPPGVHFLTERNGAWLDGVFYWTYGGLTGGAYTVTVTATNAVGTSAPRTFRWIVHPGMHDYLYPNQRSYNVGDTLTLHASFSAPVYVTGSPYVNLWADKKAHYVSGSGTGNLIFSYQVAPDDPSISSFYARDIGLGAGDAITTADGVSASLHNTYLGISDFPYYSVVNPTPQAAVVKEVYAGQSAAPARLSFGFTFTDSVTITGSPVVHITIGGAPRTATVTYAGGGGMTLEYLPRSGDNGLVVIQSPIDLNGGTITGANGQAANLAFNPPDTSTMSVDTMPPAPPVIASYVGSGTPSFQGTAEPRSSVRFQTNPNDGYLSTTTGPDGNFTFTWSYYPPLAAGTYTFTATAMDPLGNIGQPSAPVTFTVTYPVHVQTPTITSVDASGTLSGTAVPGAIVYLFNGTSVTSYSYTTADANGRWTYRPYTDNGSTYTVTAVAYPSDKTSASERSAAFTYTVGTASSTTTVVTPPTITGATGALFPTVTGTAAPGTTVDVKVTSGPTTQLPRSATAATDGAWQVSWTPSNYVSPFWSPGNYTVTATASDAAGHQSSPTTFTFQMAAHTELATPTITGIDPDTWTPGDGITSAHEVTLSGTAEPNMKVILLDHHYPGVVVTADSTGHWSYYRTKLEEVIGDLVMSAVAWDGANRASAESAPFQITSARAPLIDDTRLPHFTVGSAVNFDLRTITLGMQGSGERPMPMNYTASDLPPGFSLSAAGTLTGTPTTAGTFTTHMATMAYADAQTVKIVVADSGSTTPPPPPPPPPPPTTDPAKTNQTITFSSPVSAIIVGQPIQLGATSSAGLPITYSVVSGDATISGNVLTPTSTANLVVRASSAGNDTVNPAVVDVAFGTPQKAAQNISVATTGGIVPAEKTIALSASATSGLPITYSVVSGPATISGDTLTFTGTGTVVVRAAQPGNGTYAATDTTLTFTANPVDRLINISSMLHVGPDDGHVSIAGFVVTGSSPKPILIRAVGPSLAPFGVKDGVATPTLTLRNNAGAVVATNSGWNNDALIGATSDAVGAFRLATGSKDAAIVTTLAPGAYTAQVSSSNTGSVLIEVYDASANAAVPTKQLINISSRGAVDAGSSIIGGFVVNGAQPKRVLIRAIGPGLAAFGVSSVLADPVVKVYDAKGVVIAQNDNWETAQTVATMPGPASAAEITSADTAAGAFALNTGSKDGAVVLTLAPGSYSAVVTGANGSTGAALVEIYEVPGTP